MSDVTVGENDKDVACGFFDGNGQFRTVWWCSPGRMDMVGTMPQDIPPNAEVIWARQRPDNTYYHISSAALKAALASK